MIGFRLLVVGNVGFPIEGLFCLAFSGRNLPGHTEHPQQSLALPASDALELALHKAQSWPIKSSWTTVVLRRSERECHIRTGADVGIPTGPEQQAGQARRDQDIGQQPAAWVSGEITRLIFDLGG